MSLSLKTMAQVDVKVIQENQVQCDTAGLVSIPLTVINTGTVPIIGGAPIMSTYKINGGTPVVESIDFVSNFNPGDTVTLLFPTKYRFNQFITYNCMIAIDYLADNDVTNDTVHFTSTFNSFPGYGVHSSDTAVCLGSPATLMMELLGNGPWAITFVIGTDTAYGLPINTSVIETEMTLDSTTTFQLLTVTDVNGCTTNIGQGITITINDYPTVSLGTDTSMCAGQTLLLDAGNPGASYTWWDGQASQSYAADTADWNGVLGNHIVWVDVNQNDCISRDSVNINWSICPQGIETLNEQHFELYPNPTAGSFNISFSGITGMVSCEILDHAAKQVYSETFMNSEYQASHQCYPGNLSSGAYYVVLHNSETRLVQKLIIE